MKVAFKRDRRFLPRLAVSLLAHPQACTAAQFGRDLFDASPVGVAFCTADGRICQANAAFCELTGYEAGEVESLRTREIVHPNDFKVVESLNSFLVTGKRDRYVHEYRLQRRDGQVRWVRSHARAMRNDRGQFRFILLMLEDITEQRRIEEQCVELCATERRKVGHELHDGLGQHLTGTAFLAKLLETTVAEKAPECGLAAKQIVAKINEAIDQVRRIAQGLDPVEVGARGLESALSRLAEDTRMMSGLSCEFHAGLSLPECPFAVCHQLFRIAQEAIRNAVEHGRASRVDIHLDWKGSRLRLEIADNGCGISREKRQRTGMGLRIMQYRSRSLGGVLAIQSELNRGTRVVCLVPVNFADAPNARQSTVVHVLPGRKAGPEAFGLKAAPRRE